MSLLVPFDLYVVASGSNCLLSTATRAQDLSGSEPASVQNVEQPSQTPSNAQLTTPALSAVVGEGRPVADPAPALKACDAQAPSAAAPHSEEEVGDAHVQLPKTDNAWSRVQLVSDDDELAWSSDDEAGGLRPNTVPASAGSDLGMKDEPDAAGE